MGGLAANVGVNVHPKAGAYKDQLPEIVAWVQDMGFGFVRANDPLAPSKLAPVRVQVVIDTGDPVQAGKDAAAAVNAGAWRVECKNEPNQPANGGITLAKQINAAIVAAVAGRVPVVQSSLGQPDLVAAQELGPTPGAVIGNAHCYRANRNAKDWAAWQAKNLAPLAFTARFLPWQISETGAWWSDIPVAPTGHTPTPEDVYAEQIGPDLDSWFALGAESVCIYQALDQPGLTGTLEGHFGVKGKPVEAALRAWLKAHDGSPQPDPQVAVLQGQLTAANTALAESQAKITAAQTALT